MLFVNEDALWQDKEIRFDSISTVLKLRKGEIQCDSINSVEDTKGNNGSRGILVVTNLRLIWSCVKQAKTNLSIGWSCVTSLNIRHVSSKLRGETQALFVMTRYNSTRFEFIFTSLVKNSPRLFTTIQAVFKSYETTTLYRELKLRGAIINNKQLCLLRSERVIDQSSGIWNLSSDQGNLGVFIITTVRIVWFALLAENFNVSIPYLQIRSIEVRNSKFGQALVIETSLQSGGYILGFRIDQPDKLELINNQISKLRKVFSANPNFGVECVEEKQTTEPEECLLQSDDVEIVEDIEPCLLYHVDGDVEVDREPVYSPDLGLAMERLPEGASVQFLWSIYTN